MADKDLGVPVTFGVEQDHEHQVSAIAADLARVKAELEELGLTVTSIHVPTSGATKFFIEFPSGRPQWQVRAELEKKLYDVGQVLGKNALSFYAACRIEKTLGWAS